MARVGDATVPDDALSEVEHAAREMIRDHVADLGGIEHVSTAQMALVHVVVGSTLLVASVDRYIAELGDGLVNRRSRRVFAIVEQRARLADSLTRQLQALGLSKRAKPTETLSSYLEATYGTAEDDHEPERDGVDAGGGLSSVSARDERGKDKRVTSAPVPPRTGTTRGRGLNRPNGPNRPKSAQTAAFEGDGRNPLPSTSEDRPSRRQPLRTPIPRVNAGTSTPSKETPSC
jgi:hypothetical protein